MAYPSDLKYTKDHEWIRITGDTAEIGITDFAQQQLGDVVYVELPDVGRSIREGESFGSIESVKAVSELYAPVSGEVTEANADLAANSALVNEDAEGKAWFFKVRLANTAELDALMDRAGYDAFVKESA